MTAKKKAPIKKKTQNYVVVSNKSYGSKLKGTKIYYEGRKPSGLKDDGSFSFGKNLLETLQVNFPKGYKLILTENISSIEKKKTFHEIKLDKKFRNQIWTEKFSKDREIKNDILHRKLSLNFPTYFKNTATTPYTTGTFAKLLGKDVTQKMSSEDKKALNDFLPEYLKTEAQSAIILQASTQIDSLKALSNELRKEISITHSENWWQAYIQGKILLIQQGYIQSIEKMNVALGNTKYPDFLLATHDNYLDILEIKKPNTPILKCDSGRGNYYWDSEMARAIIQTENYIEHITKHANDIRTYVIDKYSIDLKIVKPRGIILTGNSAQFKNAKERDDFRLLSQGLKHISIVTYDELHTRMENYISVLEKFSKKSSSKKPKKKKSS